MKKVLFINSAVYLPGEGGYKRSMYLLDMMIRLGYSCTLLTSDFNHYTKTARDIKKFREEFPQYNDSIELLHKIPYKKNISILRLYSDKRFERTITKWFKDKGDEYDVVFISDQEAVLTINKIRKKKGIPLIIDIRDLFPEALKVIFKHDIVYKCLTFLFKLHEDKCFACADELVAVSKEYLDRGTAVNTKTRNSEVVYIGATLEKFDQGIRKYSDGFVKREGECWMAYAGTLGASYDLKTVIRACKKIKDHGINLVFKILGQGPEENELKRYVQKIGAANVEFLGFLEYAKMAALLSKCDITVNCIKKNASQSIINKVADYFASGKPMLNSCQNEEMQMLIEDYQTGMNYEAENVEDFIKKFMKLYTDPELRLKYGANARRLALEKFDRVHSYKKIIGIIEKASVKEI